MASDEERVAALRAVATTNDPKLKRLERVDSLTAAPARTMSEMTGRETIYFALIEALHRSDIVHLPGTVAFFELLRENRVSLDRKGRTEYLQGLVGVSVREQVGTPGSLPDDVGAAGDSKKWWQFWKRSGGES
jgi:hypothetical protein